ncbi:hypothetical protein Kpho02_59090 [Kitasatospora phosalacinea]|uniref:Uncharacterized protein n=1 Tax=Kitasatospora phosalacinea TaxID=2065 RepID=A0A9W6V5Y8_9ACTN|nr:hypothetical protein Kpho02_59090 [Kitasatospora phosalacinea]
MGRPLARGLVGGAAYAAGRAGARRFAGPPGRRRAGPEPGDRRELQAEQRAARQPVHAPPPPAPAPAPKPAPPPAPAAGGADVASRLTQPAQLLQQGLLIPEGFAAAQAGLLA